MIGIYKITNLVNGKVYIGQSTLIEKRFTRHKNTAINPTYKEYDYPLYKAMRKYGINNFVFEIIEECSVDELNEREIFYIKQYDSYKHGYNQDEGGSHAAHCKLSESDVDAIIYRLKTTKDNTHIIAKDFGVGFTTIRDINVGERHYRESEKYPIRPRIYTPARKKDKFGNQVAQTKFVSDIRDNEKLYFCPICGNNVSHSGNLCRQCYINNCKKVNRPDALSLAKIIKEFGFEETGRQFGVSGSAIKKWCKDYNISHRLKDLIKWYNEQTGTVDIVTKRKPLKKPVKQIDPKTGDVINIFESAVSAARSLGYKLGNHISEVCRGEIKAAYGFYWEYVD